VPWLAEPRFIACPVYHPPSSRVQGFRFRPAASATSRPTSVEPVNTT
jgi:hypothetical protein